MLQQILTGQTKGVALLLGAAILFLYLLPSVIAFARAHRRFFLILGLNLVASLVQALIASWLFPQLLVFDPHNIAAVCKVAALVSFGPGWVLLLVWSLAAGQPDPRLQRFKQTKTYDTIAALPLILWFAYGALQLRAALVHDGSLMLAGTASLFVWVQFISLSMAALFDLLLVYLLVVRDRAMGRSHGMWPRIFGVVGTFMGVGILQLPLAPLSLPMQLLAAVLIGVGSLGSALVLWRLGKSFSILPEARTLVTGGPYAHVRHPLYSVELITIFGTALQFAAPWSWIIAAAVVALLWIRSHFEEQVLSENFPEYGAYRARTKRFIPGIL
jgi:protein-S-isoprenylcysteine O-methyltransferase Ste14